MKPPGSGVPGTARNVRTAAFTLIEVLVSTTVGMALVVLCTTSFLRLRTLLARMSSGVEMHGNARMVYDTLQTRLGSLQQDGAIWIETTADTGAHDGSVAITFLHGKQDPLNFDFNQWDAEDGWFYNFQATDIDWARVQWTQRTSVLACGTNGTSRVFTCGPSWKSGDGKDFSGRIFLSLPQPRRVAGLPVATVLNDNRFGSPEPADIGDYQDLLTHLAPIARHVSRLSLQFVMADGTVVTADDSQTQALGFDGSYLDARVPTGGAKPSRRRPRLLRLCYDVTDPRVSLTQSFSFSFALPGLLPAHP